MVRRAPSSLVRLREHDKEIAPHHWKIEDRIYSSGISLILKGRLERLNESRLPIQVKHRHLHHRYLHPVVQQYKSRANA